MSKLKYKIYFVLCIAVLTFALRNFSFEVDAQSVSPLITPIVPRSNSVNVSALVGAYKLTLSGIIAPFASVTLISDNKPLFAAMANARGNFIISSVLVPSGFSKFCLDVIDVKHFGESYTCMSISPVTTNTDMSDIYLPPSIGLFKTRLTLGDNLMIRGYGMPNSQQTLHLSDGRTIVVFANAKGYFETKVGFLRAGQYELFADAAYQEKHSLKPTRVTKFTVMPLSLVQNGLKFLQNVFSPSLLWIWIIAIILILIIILIVKNKKNISRYFLRK